MEETKSKIKPEPERGEFDDHLDDVDMGEDDDVATDDDTDTIAPSDRNQEIQADLRNLAHEHADKEVNENLDDLERVLNFGFSDFKIPLPLPATHVQELSLKSENVPNHPPVQNVPVQHEQGQPEAAPNEVPFIAITSDDDYFERLYKDRLQSKIKMARENIQTFSKTVKYQYQPFMSVIDANERKYEGFFCEFLPPRQCPIEKSFSGRWKFKLNRMIVASGDVRGPLTPETSKVTYTVGRTFEGIKEEDGAEGESDLPPHIQRFVKEFEEFLNLTPVIQKEASRDPGATKQQKKEFYELHLRSNFQIEIMAIVNGYKNVTNEMRDALKDWTRFAGQRFKLVSVFLRTLSGNKARKFNTDHVYGDRAMMEYVGRLSFSITPTTNFYSNVSGIELFYETLVELMKPYKYDSAVMVGSGLGLVPLLLANDIKDVVGIEEKRMMIQDAETIRSSNEIHNVRFAEFEEERKVNMILEDLKKQKFFVIIDNNTNCGRSPMLLEKLQKIISLKHIVVMSTFRMTHAKPLASLFEPVDQENGLPFYPVKGCVVDPTPSSGHYQAVVLLQRFAIKKVTNDLKTEGRMTNSPIPQVLNEKNKDPGSGASYQRIPESTSSIEPSRPSINVDSKRSSHDSGKARAYPRRQPEVEDEFDLYPASGSEGSPSSTHSGRFRRRDYNSDHSNHEKYDNRPRYDSRTQSNREDRTRYDNERSYRTDKRREDGTRNLDVRYGPENQRTSAERDERSSSYERLPSTSLVDNINVLENCLKNIERTVKEQGTSRDLRYLKTAFEQLTSMKRNIPSSSRANRGKDRKRKYDSRPETDAKKLVTEDRQAAWSGDEQNEFPATNRVQPESSMRSYEGRRRRDQSRRQEYRSTSEYDRDNYNSSPMAISDDDANPRGNRNTGFDNHRPHNTQPDYNSYYPPRDYHSSQSSRNKNYRY